MESGKTLTHAKLVDEVLKPTYSTAFVICNCRVYRIFDSENFEEQHSICAVKTWEKEMTNNGPKLMSLKGYNYCYENLRKFFNKQFWISSYTKSSAYNFIQETVGMPKFAAVANSSTYAVVKNNPHSTQWCVFNNYSLDKHRHQIWQWFHI